jgi:hypothetical protein
MITTRRPERRFIEIDLRGPEGNAFVLLGKASSFCKQLGMDDSERESILSEMKSSDYDNLIEVFDKHFGEYCILYK